jgi:hypothetical protein
VKLAFASSDFDQTKHEELLQVIVSRALPFNCHCLVHDGGVEKYERKMNDDAVTKNGSDAGNRDIRASYNFLLDRRARWRG